jgi:bifunctional DNA-binding transcriptional regulator/antitoxin component of YhaV-PrlF toxin-antitoxin module
MSATAIGEERQLTLPLEVAEAAGLSAGDEVDWRFEAGEIRGRKLESPKVIIGRLIEKGGALVLDTRGLVIDEAAIAEAVRAERDSR